MLIIICSFPKQPNPDQCDVVQQFDCHCQKQVYALSWHAPIEASAFASWVEKMVGC